jgi:nucleotide-binding universal stress UspA family protein
VTAVSKTKRKVVVGVDGSAEALVAAQYAVRQAEARGLDLLLVHAYPLPPIEAAMTGDMFTCLREAAESIVADLVARLDIPPTVRVSTLVGQTAPIILLEQAAESSQLIVVGQDHVGFFERLLVGSVASRLCKDASCPVVVVPTTWRQDLVQQGPVVIALAGRSAAAEALTLAFEEAVLRQVSMIALHAMPVGASPDDVEAEERNLAELLAGYRSDYPDVAVSVSTVVGDPDRVVLESSLSASLLVVSTSRATGLASWTRSLARLVLNRTHCPVAVIPRHNMGEKHGGDLTHAAHH